MLRSIIVGAIVGRTNFPANEEDGRKVGTNVSLASLSTSAGIYIEADFCLNDLYEVAIGRYVRELMSLFLSSAGFNILSFGDLNILSFGDLLIDLL